MIRRTRIVGSLRRILVSALAAVCIIAPAHAASTQTTKHYKLSIDAGALDEALKKLAEQTGVSLVYDHRIVSGQAAPALNGAYTPRDAIGALLDGSSLEYREIDKRTIVVIEPPRVTNSSMPLFQSPTKIEKAPEIDEILVTASYRAPGSIAGVNTDYVLDAEVLDLVGAQNIAEPIHELPTTVSSFSAANTSLLITAGGLNLTDLRGLGPERSLVLINGRRFVRTSGGNEEVYGVDLNSIPTALIDRVEIINHAAGAALGTDAVAGAVNIVMRDHIDGISVAIDGGLSERGDAKNYMASLFAGAEFAGGRGRVSGGVAYGSEPSLHFSDRDYLAEPFGFALDGRRVRAGQGEFTRGFGGSTITPQGLVTGAVADDGSVILFPGAQSELVLTPGGFEPFEGRPDQLYNWIDGLTALPQIDRLHGYGRVDFDFSPDLSGFGEAFVADIETKSRLSPSIAYYYVGSDPTFGSALVVPIDHPGAPPGLRDAVESLVGAPVNALVINRRFLELGFRGHDINRRTLDISGGIEARLNNHWTLKAVFGYGQNRTKDISYGAADARRLALALDPAQCAATPGCQFLNPFDAGDVSSTTGDYYGLSGLGRHFETAERYARVIASGVLYEIDEKEGMLTVGGEFRRDSFFDTGLQGNIDEVALARFIPTPGSGAVSYGDLFAGAKLPLLSENSQIGALSFGADGRITRWSGEKYAGNISGSLSWEPIAGLEFYAYALKGARAPSVIEMFVGGLNSTRLVADPCASPSTQEAIDNCNTGGPLAVPAGFAQDFSRVNFAFTGNPDLDLEKVHSRHFGIAANISDLLHLREQSLEVSANWRLHHVKDRINFTPMGHILSACFDSAGASSPFCGINPATGDLFIQRESATGALRRVERTFVNIGETRLSGLDATLAYESDWNWAPMTPTFAVDVLYAYAHHMLNRGVFDPTAIESVGLANFPRHQIYMNASLETDRWKTLWTINGRSATLTVDTEIPEARLPARAYVDAGLQFRPAPNVILYAGVENLFDKKLPVAAFAERGFYAEYYDPIGRRYFAGVKSEF